MNCSIDDFLKDIENGNEHKEFKNTNNNSEEVIIKFVLNELVEINEMLEKLLKKEI